MCGHLHIRDAQAAAGGGLAAALSGALGGATPAALAVLSDRFVAVHAPPALDADAAALVAVGDGGMYGRIDGDGGMHSRIDGDGGMHNRIGGAASIVGDAAGTGEVVVVPDTRACGRCARACAYGFAVWAAPIRRC